MSTNLERDVSALLNIRPFESTDEDYETITQIYNSVWPEYQSKPATFKHEDDTWNEKYFYQRFIVEFEGKPVASAVCCEAAWAYKPGKYYVNCNLHPEFQKQGIGTAVYDFLMAELQPRNPSKLVAHIREDKTESVRFMTQRGYELVMRFALSELDVDAFDFDNFACLDDKMATEGIEIYSIPELEQKNVDWPEKLYELTYEILEDVPSPDPITKDSFENWQKRFLKSPSYIPAANFIALDNDQFVGYSALWKHDTRDDKLFTGLTGVVRSHRRKAVCSALKVKAFGYAKSQGVKVIETENEENNPMYQLNLKLGFEPRPAWTNYEKILKPDAGTET